MFEPIFKKLKMSRALFIKIKKSVLNKNLDLIVLYNIIQN